MPQKKSFNPLLIIAPVVAMLFGIYLGTQTTTEERKTIHNTPPIQGAVLPQARKLSNINLQLHGSPSFTVDDLTGQWSVIFAGYTNCPDVCPNTLSVLNQVDKLMTEQSITPPNVVFISIDPERDKPEIIKQYVQYFNKKFIGVTGNKNQLDSVTKQLSVVYAKQAGTSGDISSEDYLMDHSSSLLLINPDGELQSILTAPHSPMNIIDSIIRSQLYYSETKQDQA